MTTDTQPRDYGAGEFLALLLDQIEEVYYDRTEDWTSIHALHIAIAAIGESAETILESMATLADWMLGSSELSPAIRARLETIRDTCPEFAKTAGAAS